MHNAECFAVIGGTGNHDLDRGVIEWVNGLGFGKLRFTNLNMDLFPDGEEDDRLEDPEKQLAGKHLILMQSMHQKKLLLEFLDEAAIPYLLNSYLVRGLDYYTRTVF